MSGLRRHIGALTVLLFAACSGASQVSEPKTADDVPRPAQEAPAPKEDASALFARVEESLLATPRLALSATLTAEGALEASLEATLLVSNEDTRLTLKGSFNGQPVDTNLSATKDELKVGKGKPLARPAALQEALMLGFSRMGLMHNAARLTGSGLPDHADGGVRAWLDTKEHALGADAVRDGVPARVLMFAIFVQGERSADATLWIDAATLRPLERTVVVHFPQGDMRVVERYRYETK